MSATWQTNRVINMPDRIIRDEMLTSERYWSISNEAKLLFIHLMLSADDTARYTGKNFSIRTRCFGGTAMTHEQLEELLKELVTQDLIRLYEVECERYVFIPRFKQRVRFINSKYPEPPSNINDIPKEKLDQRQTKDSPKSDSSQTQDSLKTAEVKRSEEKRSKHSSPSSDVGFDEFWSAYPKKKSKGDALRAWSKIKPDATLKATILSSISVAKQSDDWTKDGGQYIPHPASWLNGRRWEDEYKPVNGQESWVQTI